MGLHLLFMAVSLTMSDPSTTSYGPQWPALVPQYASADVASMFREPWTWERLIERLRASNFIGTDARDYPGLRLPFFRAIVELGDQARFEAMLKDACPAVRCAGLQALAKTQGKASAAALCEHLTDRALVHCAWDDIFGEITVGNCAMMLLHDPNLLVSKDPSWARSPLLSENELIALEVEALATDGATAVHDRTMDDLDQGIEARKVVLALPAFRQRCPSLKDYQIIKAIGRLKPSEDQRDFLLECLRKDELGSDAKLAAASALTRHTDDVSFQAVQAEQEALNRIDNRQWGARIVEAMRTRRALGGNIRFTRKYQTWEERERIRESIVLGSRPSHPLVYDELVDRRDGVVMGDRPEVRQALGSSLVAISENLAEVNQSWNTYSNIAFKLEWLTRLIRLYRDQERRYIERRFKTTAQRIPERLYLLTDDECTEVEKNVAEFLSGPAPRK